MSSRQCFNCGVVGHFWADCPAPKNPNKEHWKAAKHQFRQERPDVRRKMRQHERQNELWKEEGAKLPFNILNKAIGDMTDTLLSLSEKLEGLSRPKEWQDASVELDSLLPRVREIAHNSFGYIESGGLRNVVVDRDIFRSRLSHMQELRDNLVQRVKVIVNGMLTRLDEVDARNNPRELMIYIFTHHPPRREYLFDQTRLVGASLKREILKALRYYHTDKQADEEDSAWKTLCLAISICLTKAKDKL